MFYNIKTVIYLKNNSLKYLLIIKILKNMFYGINYNILLLHICIKYHSKINNIMYVIVKAPSAALHLYYFTRASVK